MELKELKNLKALSKLSDIIAKFLCGDQNIPKKRVIRFKRKLKK